MTKNFFPLNSLLSSFCFKTIEKEKKELLSFPETIPDIDQACRYSHDIAI